MREVIATSPADTTEVVWLERKAGFATHRMRRPELFQRQDRTVLIRVQERGRVGSHRTSSPHPRELEGAVRHALAQAKLNPPPAEFSLRSKETSSIALPLDLFDPKVADLDRRSAGDLLQQHARGREAARLDWVEARIAVLNSKELQRTAAVTATSLQVRSGGRWGAGFASQSARALSALELPKVFERARSHRGREDPGALPEHPVPVVLSPEATIALVDLLNRMALTAISFCDGTSFLRERRGIQVFHRGVTLRDDGTDVAGLPFPFDLEGTTKRPIELIREGVPRTPALDRQSAALLGLPATAHGVAGDDARATNLFLLPGELPEDGLLQAAVGGLRISRLSRLEGFDARRPHFRAHASGVRRISERGLAEPLPDLVWEDSLVRVFSNLLGVGREAVCCADGDGVLGGISAPALAISEVTNLREE